MDDVASFFLKTQLNLGHVVGEEMVLSPEKLS